VKLNDRRGWGVHKGELRRILESEGKEVTEEWRKFHIEELYSSYWYY
jgi:hypothetical protein